MTATNHSLTGALIGLSIANPWLAVPIAFASHFVLDAIPHFGFKGKLTDDELLWRPAFKVLLAVEAILCFIIVVALWQTQPQHWSVAAICAFTAASPDLYSAPRFFKVNGITHNEVKWNRFRRFHHAIQTERVWGAGIELVWLIGTLSLFLTQLH
ncbi:MAG: hypothetical protein WAQ24_00995 [Candidatus Saccharimonadales bacterium]